MLKRKIRQNLEVKEGGQLLFLLQWFQSYSKTAVLDPIQPLLMLQIQIKLRQICMQINNSMVALAVPIHHVDKSPAKEDLVKKEKDDEVVREVVKEAEVEVKAIRETEEIEEVNKYI
jgi:hypothetical protein